MKALTCLALLGLTTFAHAVNALKLEGSCAGKLVNGKAVKFNYFSDFNGCLRKSHAALRFDSGMSGYFLGKRTFSKGEDIYSFDKEPVKLILGDSTGNTGGRFQYLDSKNVSRIIILKCQVRDYEYGECF